MAIETNERSRDVYQLKVLLLGTKPPIWRRLLVPAEMTLQHLHSVLQAAMGWEDEHLHEFRIGTRRFGKADPSGGFGGSHIASERNVPLFAVLGRTGAKAVYTYDFGDSWEHGILVEKVLTHDPQPALPVCLDGKGACPPEDCGGIPGFCDLLEAIQEPAHEEHDTLIEWLGDFDPEAFSVNEVNRRLARLQRRWNTSKKRPHRATSSDN